MIAIRIFCLVLFLAIMFGMYQLAHAAVAVGFIPWLALMVGIFWVGIKIENHDRAVEGRAPYSWYDAGRDAREVLPVVKFWGILVAVAFVLTRFI
jgi:hypothetical protein